MSHSNAIRLKAAEVRREILEANGRDSSELIPPKELLELASEHFDLAVIPAAKDSVNLRGSVAVLSNGMIFFDHTLRDGYKEYCISHELGHHVLHSKADNCSDSDIREYSAEDELPSAANQLEGYGAREKREREANLFALEFLIPCGILGKIFLEAESAVSYIREITKMSESMICSQLSTALLTPAFSGPEPSAESTRADFELDESQTAAAHAESGPLLITAGPGTGKTQTLVKRVLFLLKEQGVPPENILALTFSNKAAEEMKERIAEEAPDESTRITVMTFHGYALELLRKYFKEAGLDADSRILDKLEAILHLETNFDDLALEHLHHLGDPGFTLSKVLDNISRAKDELITPKEFLELAVKDRQDAQTADDVIRAEKALESARVYEYYQQFLETERLLDFGELIFRAVKLLQGNEQVRKTIRAKYDAILVDEFQDINRACGVMIKEIAGDGKNLWAVGDLRQSIYRWRGASPNNIRQFEEDYPGAKTLLLSRNYRSGADIVGMFSEFARGMSAVSEPEFPGWQSDPTRSASISYHIASDVEVEAAHIARECKRLQSEGVSFSQQAVIARTNPQLNKFADRLVEHGVPVLFLGNLFERPEIRDLLSLLDLISSQSGKGLYRVGRFPEYSIPAEDIVSILKHSRAANSSFIEYMAGDLVPEGLSETGRNGLAKLRSDIKKLPVASSAADVLIAYLFKDGRFLNRFLNHRGDVLNSQRLLAIHQFFMFASLNRSRFENEGPHQVEKFLEHVIRLVRFKEDKGFSHPPASTQGIDAVRLLTVHGSKGLEFDSVFIPCLSDGNFPLHRRGESVPAPSVLDEERHEGHMEEEESLFFVAMSRAKRFLNFSHAEKYSDVRISKRSIFLEALGPHLPEGTRSEKPETVVTPLKLTECTEHKFKSIRRYLECPRQYYYRHVLELETDQDVVNAYKLFKFVVRETLRDIQRTLKKGHAVDERLALDKLDLYWQLGDLDTRISSKSYRARAEEMMKILVDRIGNCTAEIRPESISCDFENGKITIEPDHLEISDDGVFMRRFKTERGKVLDEGVDESADDEEVLLHLAAKQTYHGASVIIENTYLGSDTDRTVKIKERGLPKRVSKFEKALTGIRSRNFAPKRGNHCFKCSYYFICGSE